MVGLTRELRDLAMPIFKRATTLAELHERSGSLATEYGKRLARSFRPKPTDVVIATYPKSGTTWMQQIVHGLRTRGSMDFEEITQVVPWLEMAFDLGIDPESQQLADPRVFKSHLTWHEVPKGARYISVVRDPKDVVVSSYHFHEGWRFEPGTISADEFTRDIFLSRARERRYWHHVSSWWEQRDRSDVLILCYENIKEDLLGSVQKVAEFIGCEPDEDLLEIVVKQSSIEFMRAHESKFDDHLVRDARNAVRRLPPGGASSKVRAGRVGDHRVELSEDVCRTLDAIWREEMNFKFSLRSYEALREYVAELPTKSPPHK